MKLAHLIIRKIIKFVATRCHNLKLKCTKFNFGWGSAYSAPPEGAYGSFQPFPDLADSRALVLLRLWRYINHVLTYLLTYLLTLRGLLLREGRRRVRNGWGKRRGKGKMGNGTEWGNGGRGEEKKERRVREGPSLVLAYTCPPYEILEKHCT